MGGAAPQVRLRMERKRDGCGPPLLLLDEFVAVGASDNRRGQPP